MITAEKQESCWLVRLEGEIGTMSAAELKTALIDGLASGKEIRLDLEHAEEIDVTVIQLLWAAGREAERRGIRIGGCLPDSLAVIARDAGFERFPVPLAVEE
jgi:anti-anti-sigma regulatory factor